VDDHLQRLRNSKHGPASSLLFRDRRTRTRVQFARRDGLPSCTIARGSEKENLAKKLGAHHYITATLKIRLPHFKPGGAGTDPRYRRKQQIGEPLVTVRLRRESQAMRPFVLTRLTRLELTKRSLRPTSISIRMNYSRAAYRVQGQGRLRGRDRLDVWATDLSGPQWHASQDFTELQDGIPLEHALEQHRRDGAMGAARHGGVADGAGETLRQTIAGLTNPYAE